MIPHIIKEAISKVAVQKTALRAIYKHDIAGKPKNVYSIVSDLIQRARGVSAYRNSVDEAGNALKSAPTSYAQRRMVKQLNAARYKMYSAMGSDKYKKPISADGRWFYEAPALKEPGTVRNFLKHPEEHGRAWKQYKSILGAPEDIGRWDLDSEKGRQIAAYIDNPQLYSSAAQRYRLQPQLVLPDTRFFNTRHGKRLAEALKNTPMAEWTLGEIDKIKDTIIKDPKKYGGRLAELLQLKGNKINYAYDPLAINNLLGAGDSEYSAIRALLTKNKGLSLPTAASHLEALNVAKENKWIMDKIPKGTSIEDATQLIYLINNSKDPERVGNIVSRGETSLKTIKELVERDKWYNEAKSYISRSTKKGNDLPVQKDIWIKDLPGVREYRRGTYLISGSPQWGNVCTSHSYDDEVAKGVRRLIGVGTGKDRRLLHYRAAEGAGGELLERPWKFEHFIGPNNSPVSSNIDDLPEAVRKQLPDIERYLHK